MEEFSRTAALIGEDGVIKLKGSKAAVIGLGGVGSFAAEALARAGIGTITVIDNDIVSLSNINRQLYALHSTVGKYKADIAAERIIDINPECNVIALKVFVTAENIPELNLRQYDYIVDAIDSVGSKLDLIKYCHANDINIISCMGTGNKLDPSKFQIADIFATSVCPLERKIRYELKKAGITNQKVLFSTEPPLVSSYPPASISFVPSAAGMLLAGEVIKDLLKT